MLTWKSLALNPVIIVVPPMRIKFWAKCFLKKGQDN